MERKILIVCYFSDLTKCIHSRENRFNAHTPVPILLSVSLSIDIETPDTSHILLYYYGLCINVIL